MNRALWINERRARQCGCAGFYRVVARTCALQPVRGKRCGARQCVCAAFYRVVAKPRALQPMGGKRRGARTHARPPARRKPYALASSSTSAVAYVMNDVISSTARRASGLTSKLSWNMCIALSHT